MEIRLDCQEQPPCNGEFLYQYIEPLSELGETVIECGKCGKFLKTSQPIEGLKLRDDATSTGSTSE